MNTLYIPVSNGSTSLDGLIALFINRWSGNKTRSILVECAINSPLFAIQTDSIIGSFENALTTLPFLVVGESPELSKLTVSGLAAVSRLLLKNSECKKALGFRGNCLQAPAEVSIWTAFCEVQMPLAARTFIKTIHKDVIEIPTTLVQFEEHLKQPIRMHNVVKRYLNDHGGQESKEVQKMAGSWLEHTFAEGPDMTLADLLLYPCTILISEKLAALGVKLADHLPLVHKWSTTMKPLVEQAWNAVMDVDLSLLTITTPAVVKLPRIKEASLYKKDSSRPGIGCVTTEDTSRVVDNLKEQNLWPGDKLIQDFHIDVAPCSEFTARIDWSTLPDPAHPQQGHVPGSRLDRKIQQLDGMAAAVIDSVSIGDVIVDFCSGGGHLGILLAYLLPNCSVIMIDNKEESVKNARQRVAKLELNNVTLIQSNLDYFRGRFDLGVALHACGVATDLVLHACLAQQAAFVLCPCCYGNLAHLPDKYPQSKLFRNIPSTDFSILARIADHLTITGRMAMAAVDLDRICRAAQDGYRVTLTKLKPDSCSPKHDLIIGIP